MYSHFVYTVPKQLQIFAKLAVRTCTKIGITFCARIITLLWDSLARI